MLPDFHGNRSLRADPTLRGMISGLRSAASVASLALLYLATVQAIAHGTRHIVDTMNAAGYRIETLVACGGDTENPVLVREHADATGCRVILPKEREAVLLGAAMLGAVASGNVSDVMMAMSTMNQVETVVAPGGAEVRAFHAGKHGVFHRMRTVRPLRDPLRANSRDGSKHAPRGPGRPVPERRGGTEAACIGRVAVLVVPDGT